MTKKDDLRAAFPDMTDDELEQAQKDPDAGAQAYATRVGRPFAEVREQFPDKQ